MFGLIKFFQKRPSDITIRLIRIIIGLIIVGGGYYNLIYMGDNIETNFFWIEVSEKFTLYIKYLIILLGIIPLFLGLTNMCLLKKKYIKYIQSLFGILLIYFSGKIVESNKLDFDTLLFIIGIIPLLLGITGKCVTSKCLKYKEKITKIRV